MHFLVGNWQGSGQAHGEPITATLHARLCLADTFLEATEHLFDASGALDHEDICFYRYDEREGHLRVRQLTVPALHAERMVLPLPEGGIRWYEGPLGIQVFFIPQPDGSLVERVFLPLQDRPAITIRYQRST